VTEDDAAARSPTDLAQQMREAADRLMTGWTRTVGSVSGAVAPGLSAMPHFPALPATVSAQQVQKLLDDLSARRLQVQTLRDQLTTFDEQLGMLEASLQPVAEWTRTWAAAEKSVSDFWRAPGGTRPGSG